MNFKIKIALSTIIVIVMMVAIVGFIILPTIGDIKAISNAIYDERVDLEKKYLRGQLLKKTVSDFEAIRPQKDILETIFIKTGEELTFVSVLEDIASANNVRQILDLQTKNIEEKKGIKYLPLKITVEGQFSQVMNYLQDLENTPYYFNISDIQINANRDLVTAIFNGHVFSQTISKNTEE